MYLMSSLNSWYICMGENVFLVCISRINTSKIASCLASLKLLTTQQNWHDKRSSSHCFYLDYLPRKNRMPGIFEQVFIGEFTELRCYMIFISGGDSEIRTQAMGIGKYWSGIQAAKCHRPLEGVHKWHTLWAVLKIVEIINSKKALVSLSNLVVAISPLIEIG